MIDNPKTSLTFTKSEWRVLMAALNEVDRQVLRGESGEIEISSFSGEGIIELKWADTITFEIDANVS